jgi:hypothetical protein
MTGQHSLPSGAGGPHTTIIADAADAGIKLSEKIRASANHICYCFPYWKTGFPKVVIETSPLLRPALTTAAIRKTV